MNLWASLALLASGGFLMLEEVLRYRRRHRSDFRRIQEQRRLDARTARLLEEAQRKKAEAARLRQR